MRTRYYKIFRKVLVNDSDGGELAYYRLDPTKNADAEWPWLHGGKFKYPPQRPLVFEINLADERAGKFADYQATPIPLVSERFRKALESIRGAKIEFYPTKMIGADRFDTVPVYFALNIHDCLFAANMEKSLGCEALSAPGTIIFEKLVLDPDIAGNRQIFRLGEHPPTVLVSEEVKQACELLSIDTLIFEPIK